MLIFIVIIKHGYCADFTIIFNQTSYTVAVDHSLALTGIPLVRYTVFISEAVTSTSITNGWTSFLSSTAGSPTNLFTGNAVEHPFPANVTSPLVDSDTIAVATCIAPPPPPGIYSYELLVSTIANVGGTPQAITDSSELIIQLIETPGKQNIRFHVLEELAYLILLVSSHT